VKNTEHEIQDLFDILTSFYFDIQSEAVLLYHVLAIFLIFQGISTQLTMMAAQIHNPMNNVQRLLFSISSSTFISNIFHNSYPKSCGVISYCGFGLYFFDD
jgi:hypothetical protein